SSMTSGIEAEKEVHEKIYLNCKDFYSMNYQKYLDKSLSLEVVAEFYKNLLYYYQNGTRSDEIIKLNKNAHLLDFIHDIGGLF
ncbi:hypothetical protein ABLA30_22765, partial [Xenorhabdus nematophila]